MLEKGIFTSIGSWPFTDVDKITGLILDNFKDLPPGLSCRKPVSMKTCMSSTAKVCPA